MLEEQKLLRRARSKPVLDIYLTDLSEQAEAMTRRFLGADFGRVSPTIPEFEQKLLKGEPLFVFMNPYHAVLAYQKQKYQPLLADNEDLLTGILVVRADSPIKSIDELKRMEENAEDGRE